MGMTELYIFLRTSNGLIAIYVSHIYYGPLYLLHECVFENGAAVVVHITV